MKHIPTQAHLNLPESLFDMSGISGMAMGASRWVVGFSGGVDSAVLLHALANIAERPDILAIHVHHGLNAKADEWSNHCREVSASLGVDFVCEHLTLADEASLENAARKARYEAFAKHVQSTDALLLGHHQNDQAETVLFRLFRGSGLKGLGAMKSQSEMRVGGVQLRIARPLLQCSKADILQYAKSHQLTWVDDDSNQDVAMDRNFLRNRVIPLIESRWPKASEKIAQMSHIAQAQSTIVNSWCKQQLQACLVKENQVDSVSIEAVLKYSASERALILHYWCEMHGETVSYEQHEQLEASLAQYTNEHEIELSDSVLRFFNGCVYLLDKAALKLSHAENMTIEVNGSVDWCGGLVELVNDCRLLRSRVIDGRKLEGKVLTLRFRQSTRLASSEDVHAEVCRIEGRGSRKLKKILQEEKLEPWLRAQVPLLFANDELVAVADYVVDEAYLADKDIAADDVSSLQLQWSPKLGRLFYRR